MSKGLFFSLAIGVSVFCYQAKLSYAESTRFQPEQVRLLPERTFIPFGFDNNDNVQFVVIGKLPNTCYKAGTVNTSIDLNNKKIYFSHSSYFYPGCWCLQVLVPYTHTVDLGIIPSGQYELVALDQQNRPHFQGMLIVGASKTSAPDDHLYAPIQEISLNTVPSDSNPTLVLKGDFGNDCMEFQEAKVLYRTENIIEVLPIARIMEKAQCKPSHRPFEIPIKLNSPWKGQTLLYVRSLNGQSISKIVDFE